jgi:chromosome segregation ATPase
LAEKDTLINSLRDETASLKTQHENSQRDVSRHATSLVSKDKEIATLKSTDSEKDSLISSLQLEIGQLKDQLSSVKESTGSAPTAEQFAALVSERGTLKAQVTDLENDSEKTHKQLQTLQNEHTALEKDTKTTHETLVNLRNEYAKLKESHSSEIQKSRLVQSRAAELQIENKTLMSRVDELKKKLISLTTEKLELVERAETQERELYRLRRERMVVSSGGGRGSVEMDTELDALIEGQKTRQAIRETNQRRYSQFVGQAVSEEAEGETMRDINERRLKKGKESGEFGREKETGFVVDLMSIAGGCGMCVGEALVL